jgi:poly(rC)-binding protein 2/3/4
MQLVLSCQSLPSTNSHNFISFFLFIQIPAEPIFPAIEALILLHDKVSAPCETGEWPDHEKKGAPTPFKYKRLVVPSSKVCCILGEGRKVITEMRRRTGAEIRVYSKTDKPKYLSFDDELVQVVLFF